MPLDPGAGQWLILSAAGPADLLLLGAGGRAAPTRTPRSSTPLTEEHLKKLHGTPLPQTGAVTATELRLYTPYRPGGGLLIGVAVTGSASGSCFAASVASPTQPDASRCMTGNRTFNPCFASLNARNPLACSGDPWGANAVLHTRKGNLSRRSKASEPNYVQGTSWALKLANGQRCVVLTGATAPVAGLRMNYGCPDGGIVAGPIDRTSPVWRAFYQTGNRSLSLAVVNVRVAWF